MSEPAATQPTTTVEPSPTTAAPHTITVDVMVKLQAVAIREADGRYSVVVPALPGCLTQAETLDDLRANIIESSEGWLAVAHDRNKEQAVRDMLE